MLMWKNYGKKIVRRERGGQSANEINYVEVVVLKMKKRKPPTGHHLHLKQPTPHVSSYWYPDMRDYNINW